jgi:hypothetical protein
MCPRPASRIEFRRTIKSSLKTGESVGQETQFLERFQALKARTSRPKGRSRRAHGCAIHANQLEVGLGHSCGSGLANRV